jgi:hypothetical protein
LIGVLAAAHGHLRAAGLVNAGLADAGTAVAAGALFYVVTFTRARRSRL